MAEDEQRRIRIGFPQFQRLGQRCDGKAACPVGKQRRGNTNRAEAVAVCFDDRHDGDLRANHGANGIHVAGKRGEVNMNVGVARERCRVCINLWRSSFVVLQKCKRSQDLKQYARFDAAFVRAEGFAVQHLRLRIPGVAVPMLKYVPGTASVKYAKSSAPRLGSSMKTTFSVPSAA